MANRKKQFLLFPIAYYVGRRNLFYRAVASQVSLAKMSLTSVFGMGTGGTSSQSSPTVRTTASKLNNEEKHEAQFSRSSPRPISTCWLNTSLHLHLRPINLIVFQGSYSIKDGISYLKGGFTLRCLQRLSVPHIAARPCHWRDNRCTRGASIPVLSY